MLDRYDPKLVEGFKVPMPDYLASRGLGDMVQWANGKATAVNGNGGDGDKPVTPPPTVGSNLAKFKSHPDYPKIMEQVPNITDPEVLNKVLGLYSKSFQIPEDVLKKEFGITQ